MFDDNPTFTVLNGAVRVMIIGRKLATNMYNLNKLPTLRLKDNKYMETYHILAINIIMDIHPTWRELLTSAQLDYIEGAILDEIGQRYPQYTPCNINNFKEYIKK